MTLFGDHFGQRSDYSKGVFYANHHKYLCSHSKLEPPAELRTKRHTRHQSLLQSNAINEESLNLFGHMDKKHAEDDSVASKFRKAAKSVKYNSVLSPSNRTSMAAVAAAAAGGVLAIDGRANNLWVEEFQAGVRLWVNKESGDVVRRNPWERDQESVSVRLNHGSKPGTGKLSLHSLIMIEHSNRWDNPSADIPLTEKTEQLEKGTGSLVYNSGEIHELFDILDRCSPKNANLK